MPIVALKDATTSLKCDICMCNKLALRNSQLLRAYMSLDPRARQLGFIIKYWAKRRAINDPYRGSPSSYAWVLLVIHYLQTTSPPVLPVLQELHSPSVSTTNTFVRAHDGRAFDCYFFHEVEASPNPSPSPSPSPGPKRNPNPNPSPKRSPNPNPNPSPKRSPNPNPNPNPSPPIRWRRLVRRWSWRVLTN